MRSGWFFQTPMWAEYWRLYYHGPEQYRSSALADDACFDWDQMRAHYDVDLHDSRVIDLTVTEEELWRQVRKSYRSKIHEMERKYPIMVSGAFDDYIALHKTFVQRTGGVQRPDATYECQRQWILDGYGLLIATAIPQPVAAAYWIVYQDKACWMSGPNIEEDVPKAIVWYSLKYLKAMGVTLVDLGRTDWTTKKEEGIAKFKLGFGGYNHPISIITRRTHAEP